MRITVRVQPRSARPGVGGHHDEALVAAAFGVSRGSVTVVSGARSRVKILDVAGADPATLERLLAR